MAVTVTSTRDRSSLAKDLPKLVKRAKSEVLADLVAAIDSVDDETLDDAFDILDEKESPDNNEKAATFLNTIARLTGTPRFACRQPMNASVKNAAEGWIAEEKSYGTWYRKGDDLIIKSQADGEFIDEGYVFGAFKGKQDLGFFDTFGEAVAAIEAADGVVNFYG